MIFSYFSGKAIRKAQLRSTSKDTINLSGDFPEALPSPQVMEAMERALRSPETFGKDETFAAALAEKLKALPVAGGENALRLTLQAWIAPGDEVIIFAPCPPHHVLLVNLLGGVPKVIKLDEEEGFFPEIDALKAQITPRTRAVIFTNPQHPTGVLWDKETLTELGKLIASRGLLAISDERGSFFIYEGQFCSFSDCTSDKNHTVVIGDIAPALSGWDASFIRACPEFINRVKSLASTGGGGLNSTSLFVLNEAWGSLTPPRLIEELNERREALLTMLSKQHGLRITRPRAGTNCFSNVCYYLGNEIGGEVPTNSDMFADIVFRKANVLVASGLDYGMGGFIKCSFTQNVKLLTEAVDRVSSILEQGFPKR